MSDKSFEASLKSIETENLIDLYFYRPIGYRLARMLQHTGVTPNMVTILSIFVGAGTGYLFYFTGRPEYTVAGILLLIVANILDCVDGQLARLTGIKSEIGRILDGMAGDIWFTLIYVGLALRLTHLYGSGWFFVPAVASGLSHLLQAGITDYYKTLHLYFVSKEKGREFHSIDQVKAQQRAMKSRTNRAFFALYEVYTRVQEFWTPALQRMLRTLQARYGDDIPEPLRQAFRSRSRHLMTHFIDFMTFNGRTVVLFLVMLLSIRWSGIVWIYFVYEIVVLNVILLLSVHRHEQICRDIITLDERSRHE